MKRGEVAQLVRDHIEELLEDGHGVDEVVWALLGEMHVLQIERFGSFEDSYPDTAAMWSELYRNRLRLERAVMGEYTH